MNSPLLRPALALYLGLGLALAPAAQQRVVDDRDPGTSARRVSDPPQLGDDIDDRDPGAARYVEPRLRRTFIVSDQDADAVLTVGPVTAAVLQSSVERAFDHGRSRETRRPVAEARLTGADGALDNGRSRETRRDRAARTVSALEAPLDKGRRTDRAGARIDIPGAATQAQAVADGADVPILLSAVRPNPTGNRASLTISVVQSSHATVSVYDVQGRVVSVPFVGVLDAGVVYRVDVSGADLAPGVYVVVLSASGHTASRTFQVVR